VDALLRALVAAGLIDQDTADVMRRRLDPVAFRAWADAEIERATVAGLTAQQGRLVDLLRAHNYNPTAAQWARFWRREDELLWDSMRNAFARVGTERQAAAHANIESGDITFDLPNLDAREWVTGYYTSPSPLDHGSVPNLDQTSREQVEQVFRRWINGDLEGAAAREQGIPAFIRALEPTFGPVRARRVAVTEATRIFTEGQRQAEADNEFTTMFRVSTSRDERVCPICGPLDGQTREKGTYTYQHPELGPIAGPPFHVNCRCGETPETALSASVAPLRQWHYAGEAA
jgi:SPP1 gp7 family putative phage head morphogenesis protein